MKKKRIVLFLALVFLCSMALQSKADRRSPAAYSKPLPALLSVKSPTTLLHDTCLNKKISVVFYVILDSLNSLPNTTPASIASYTAGFQLSLIIARLNTTFTNICVSFENCRTVIIPNYSYNMWRVGETDSIVTASWYTEKTLNIYMVNTAAVSIANPPVEADKLINAPPGHEFGYSASFPTGTLTAKDYIVIEKNYALAPNNAVFSGSYLLHAMGHYFGLPHTFAEISVAANPAFAGGPSLELVNGSNSVIRGDGFEDTEADGYPNAFVSSGVPTPPCYYKYIPGSTDVTGSYYTPPVDNFMSIYNCRCRFTQQQYNYMARMILTKRLYLH